ncbi:MAG: hypothetical protein WDN29_01435 [Methylovirgula sp.]
MKINMTTIAFEAGYARTYLYKNSLPRVMARIEAITKPPIEIRSTKDLAEELRRQRNQALSDRDKAIDAARRWMQNYHLLEQKVKELEQKLLRVKNKQEAGLSSLRH